MTLPNETLWNVLEFIPRSEVVAVIVASRKLRHVVESNIATAPRRGIAAMTLCSNSEFALATNDSEGTSREYTFAIENAPEVLKCCSVESAHFQSNVLVDDALLAILVKIRSAWENGEVYVHCAYESTQILQQALNVVFFGRALVLHLPAKAQLENIEPLLSLLSVQFCTELWLFGPNGRVSQGMFNLSAEDIANWLHLNVKPGQRRQLRTRDYLTARVTFDLQQLIRLLVQRFTSATTALEYEAELTTFVLYATNVDVATLENSYTNIKTKELFEISVKNTEPFDEVDAPEQTVCIKRIPSEASDTTEE